jgi:CTP synthase (UTP-ammonia lyase)
LICFQAPGTIIAPTLAQFGTQFGAAPLLWCMPATIRIGLVGDHDPAVTAHRAIPLALTLAATALDVTVEATWVGTASLDPEVTGLAHYHGIWCVPASPYQSMQGALNTIQMARVERIPFLGTCAGFQHAVIEYARSVLGLVEADHGETNPAGNTLVIAALNCALVETRGTVHLVAGSQLAGVYGAPSAEEGYHCNYGLAPQYAGLFDLPPLRIAARDRDDGGVRAIELADHPFFVATLYQPERAALNGTSHPLIKAFVSAARCHSDALAVRC